MRTSFLVYLCLFATATSTPLDDYLAKDDQAYKWEDTGDVIDTTFGGKGYVLNVTSQRWLDTSVAYGPDGDLWTHQVVVIVPKLLRSKETALAYITGGCNSNPSPPKAGDEDVLVADTVAALSGSIAIVVFQIPNCPIVYPSDPSLKRRTEDAVIAWGWHLYLNEQNPEYLARLPMTKGAFKCMQAAQEFLTSKSIASINGWAVAGASKRGWTTWMVGAATCPTCPNIVGIAPLVPIVPDLRREMHRMWQSYGGWTFAFTDYIEVNLTRYIDDPAMIALTEIVDPKYYGDRLSRLPKMVCLSSDDEFMMFDWSNIWYDELTGEKHLYIVQDSEHSLSTGIIELLPALSTFVSSIAHGKKTRPSFDYGFDNKTGALSVTITEGVPKSVRLWQAHTLQDKRRDFRWVRLANNDTEPCRLPDIPLPKPVFGGNCIQPILWKPTNLTQTGGSYSWTPPPNSAKYQGYYIEVVFPGDTGLRETNFQFTTPGFIWPNTLPFPDCQGAACEGHLL